MEVAAYLTIAGSDSDAARERDSARIELRLFEIVAAIGSGGRDKTGGAGEEGDDVAAGGGGLTVGCERTLTLTVAGKGTGSTGGSGRTTVTVCFLCSFGEAGVTGCGAVTTRWGLFVFSCCDPGGTMEVVSFKAVGFFDFGFAGPCSVLASLGCLGSFGARFRVGVFEHDFFLS